MMRSVCALWLAASSFDMLVSYRDNLEPYSYIIAVDSFSVVFGVRTAENCLSLPISLKSPTQNNKPKADNSSMNVLTKY